MSRDPHNSLKSEVISKTSSGVGEFVLAKSQWGKNDSVFSLHVIPSSYSLSGIQSTDFLGLLNFERSNCPFGAKGECYWIEVEVNFSIEKFTPAFSSAFSKLQTAEKALEACGITLERSEGWGYFNGSEGHSQNFDWSMSGDGHTAIKHESLKQAEDDFFHFRFSWIEKNNEKGWVIHYQPKNSPTSSEFVSVLGFLELNEFEECPEFDFDHCFYKTIIRTGGRDFLGGNADLAHRIFDAHSSNFSNGIKNLLEANAEIEAAGLTFLPFSNPKLRLQADLQKKTMPPLLPNARPGSLSMFDVAISFSGAEREYAEQVAKILREQGFSVFYDQFHPEYLWGKNLVDAFDEIYRKKSKFCLIFVSKSYLAGAWTNHERQSAQAHAFEERGSEYILPIQVDDSKLPGMPPTIGYLPISLGVEKISDLLIKKLRA
jgi:hypothetical protein